MKKVWVVLGNIWMLPNTILTGLYLLVFWAMGWVVFEGVGSWSLKVRVLKGSWLWEKMGDWVGWSGGCFIIMRIFYDRGIKHEERHTKQQMVFGVLQPVLYVLCSVFIYFFLRNQHPYYSNPFEIDARRAAGQMVLVPKEYWDDENRWIWW
ncbi:MAG: hypothetical protein AM326_03360 [Candidatus Thorarchaeota archaeon SMTZ-45]|nr:MAG: hypothetical protein AM326_03360 [Candidatus Thorarchaeota archaeon SMTZ-45]